jgi:hypothetical protein
MKEGMSPAPCDKYGASFGCAVRVIAVETGVAGDQNPSVTVNIVEHRH